MTYFDLIASFRNPYLDYFFQIINNTASIPVLVVLLISLYIFKHHKEMLKSTIIISITWIIILVLKFIVQRPRPLGNVLYIPLTNVVDYSFPSQHAATSFALAYAFSKFFGHRKEFYALATIVSLTRIYFGLHYISDVVAGALLGTIVAALVLDWDRFLNFLRGPTSSKKIIFALATLGKEIRP